MAWKCIKIYTKLLDAARIAGVNLVNQYSGTVRVKIYQQKPKTKDDFTNFKEHKASLIDTIGELLNVRKFTALDLVMQQKSLYLVNSSIIRRNHGVLQRHGIKNGTIINNPELLAIRQPTDLEKNVQRIKQLPYKLDDVIYLACMEPRKLERLLSKANFLQKVDVLIRKLDTTVDVIMKACVKRPFLPVMAQARIEESIDLLKANDISSSDIIKDLWVLQYASHVVLERINIARENNIDPIKTWMVRCTLDVLQRYIQRRSDNKQVLGDNTIVEYLAERLDCTLGASKSLMIRLPALENKSMKKLRATIDFLYAEGFKPVHIRRVPKILLHSVETTKKRIRELERQGVKMESLHMLTKSQRQYMEYYEALVKSNAKKLKQLKGSKAQTRSESDEVEKGVLNET